VHAEQFHLFCNFVIICRNGSPIARRTQNFSRIEKRREIAKRYEDGLKNVENINTPPSPAGETHFDVFQNYVLKAQKRDELAKYLEESGVETLIKDRVANHKHPNLGLDHFSLPYTEQLANEVISLPMYPELTDEQVQYVIEGVKEFYSM